MDQRDAADNTEPTLAADPTESSEPTDPIDKIEPAEPMDKIDPAEPIDKMDPLDPMLRIEPAEPLPPRPGPTEPLRPMRLFSHHDAPNGRSSPRHGTSATTSGATAWHWRCVMLLGLHGVAGLHRIGGLTSAAGPTGPAGTEWSGWD
jgi:hypothetical protein